MAKQAFEKWLEVKDLAKRAGVAEKTVRNWVSQGILKPIKGIPAIKFSPDYISELEGVQMDKFSPLERVKMQTEIDRLNKELKELKQDTREALGKLMQNKKIWES